MQLMVALPSVVPATGAAALSAARLAWPATADADFAKLPRQATLPVARLATKGYVYLLDVARGVWDVWQVMPSGLTRKLLHQVNPDQYAEHSSRFSGPTEAKSCSRGAANVPAQLISVFNAGGTEKLWLAFSGHWWTATTLKRYAANPQVQLPGPDGKPGPAQPLRTLRGREINPKQVLSSKKAPTGCLSLTQAHLEQHLADFSPSPRPEPDWPSKDFAETFAAATPPLEPVRFGQAATFAQAVRQLERASAPTGKPEYYANTSLIVVLPDPVGVCDAHNEIRLHTLSQRQGWMAGGVDSTGKNADPKRPWERQSLLHAGYIREWVRSEKEALHRERLDGGLYRAEYIISAFEYQKILEQEARTKDTVNPPGTTYQKLPGTPERYRVTFPPKFVDQGIKGLADASAKPRIARYNEHLDTDAIDKANQRWKTQEEGWAELLTKRDADYVAWLEQPATVSALRHDFDDDVALRKHDRTPAQLKTDVHEAAAQLDVMARCYGGGACSGASLKHLVTVFGKDERDPYNFISRAILGELGLLDKAVDKFNTESGTQADLYDALVARKAAWNEFRDAWQQASAITLGASDTLMQTAMQITQRMKELALRPELAKQHGLKVKLADAAKKQVVWGRAVGVLRFANENIRQYMVGVRWSAGEFSVASTDPTLTTSAIDTDPRTATGKQARKKRLAVRAENKRRIKRMGADPEATIMLVIDEKQLARGAARRGEKMVQVVSPGIFGLPQGVVEIPESLAREVVRDGSRMSLGNLKNVSTALNGGVLWLQAWAVAESWENIAKTGGWDQIDAVASLMGGITGIAGAGAEVAAVLLTPAAASRAGTPLAAELAARVPAHLRWKFAAGVFMAAGAVFDAAVAFAKALKFDRQGDDAAGVYAVTGATQLVGGMSLGVGQYYAYRAAVLNRLGQQGTVRILAAAFSPVQLSRCLTGIGLLLWVGGLGLSFYALYLEDDFNEIFLRRSFFAKDPPKDLGRFQDLDQEVQSFAALALGSMCELEWHDNWTEADEITVRVKVFAPEPTAFVMARVEGFDAINGKKVATVFEGELPSLGRDRPPKGGYPPDPPESAHRSNASGVLVQTERRMAVPKGVEAIHFSYQLFKDRTPRTPPIAQGEGWTED
jgi:hypothetical protein